MKKNTVEEDELLIISEPMLAYGAVNYFSLANNLITKEYIKSVLEFSKLSLTELIAILPISIDTYKRKTTFGPAVTEKVLEIEEVYKKGINSFDSGFHQWMNAENIALDGLKPKEMLANSFGIRRLLEQIGRIEHGVLA